MSATVPMEFSFGSAGNLKSARRLRNLDLKRKRPTVHPLFGNTGSVVGKAYAATGGRVGPLYKGATPTSISGKSTLPLKSGTKLINQGIASEQNIDGGGEILPRAAAQNPVIPSGDSPQKIVQAAEPKGFFSSGTNILLAGGGLVAVVIIAWMFLGNKKSRKHRRKNNNGKKARRK
jgi:hypothetical protein